MKLIRRLINLFKSTAHDTLDYMEDPGALARQAVRDLMLQIAVTEEAAAKILSEQKSISLKYHQACDSMQLWRSKAEKAVKTQNDTLARAALVQAQKAEQISLGYNDSLSLLAPRVTEIKNKLEALRKIKDQYVQEASLLDARAKAAKAINKALQILGNIGTISINFENLREKVDQMEFRSQALQELGESKSSLFSERELSETTAENNIEIILEDMKSKITGRGI